MLGLGLRKIIIISLGFIVFGVSCKSKKESQDQTSTCITSLGSGQYLVDLSSKSWKEDGSAKYQLNFTHMDSELFNCGYDVEFKIAFCGSEYVASIAATKDINKYCTKIAINANNPPTRSIELNYDQYQILKSGAKVRWENPEHPR